MIARVTRRGVRLGVINFKINALALWLVARIVVPKTLNGLYLVAEKILIVFVRICCTNVIRSTFNSINVRIDQLRGLNF